MSYSCAVILISLTDSAPLSDALVTSTFQIKKKFRCFVTKVLRERVSWLVFGTKSDQN
jgi:hypothetical protein